MYGYLNDMNNKARFTLEKSPKNGLYSFFTLIFMFNSDNIELR